MAGRPRRSRIGDWLLGVWVVTCAFALTWPGYAWLGNRIEPYVAGVPASLAWVVGWVVATFLPCWNTCSTQPKRNLAVPIHLATSRRCTQHSLDMKSAELWRRI